MKISIYINTEKKKHKKIFYWFNYLGALFIFLGISSYIMAWFSGNNWMFWASVGLAFSLSGTNTIICIFISEVYYNQTKS